MFNIFNQDSQAFFPKYISVIILYNYEQQYAHVNGTFVIPTGMNTMNQQEMDRYVYDDLLFMVVD